MQWKSLSRQIHREVFCGEELMQPLTLSKVCRTLRNSGAGFVLWWWVIALKFGAVSDFFVRASEGFDRRC